MKKKIIITVSLLLAVLVILFITIVAIPEMKNEKVRHMQINNVDLSKVEDGTYQGEYAYGHYTYRVNVKVKNHSIESIDVHHGRKSKRAKAAEGVIKNVIKEQNVDVDVVSGATTTSKAILKAIENALSQ